MGDERSKRHAAGKGGSGAGGTLGRAALELDGHSLQLTDGAVLIAAITSCTNTSNPYVLMAAGLLARNARRAGLNSKPWVKTSLAPARASVTDYLQHAGLLEPLGEHRLRPGRLRLHHLHREFRPPEARDPAARYAPAI